MAREYMRNCTYSYIQLEDDAARNCFRDDFINKMRHEFQDEYSYLFKSDGFDLRHAPHNFYLNAIKNSSETHNQSFSVTFPQILNSGSNLIDSLHLNYLVDIEWVCLQYVIAAQNPRMTIIHQKDFFENNQKPNYADLQKVIKIKKMEFDDVYSHHHSKISVFKYDDGKIRIMISTANLFVQDWENRTQGFWISPLLPPVFGDINGDSETRFKKDFLNYLKEYGRYDLSPLLEEWSQTISKADFSGVNVFFIGSVKGNFPYEIECPWGHLRLDKILFDYITLPSDEASQWPLIIQASHISADSKWMEYYLKSMLQHNTSKQEESIATTMVKVIYPSRIQVVEDSLDYKQLKGTHLEFDENSLWLKNIRLLSQWKADNTSRSTALPHIKSYTRLSTNPEKPEILWFVLTSANLSRGAWGIHNNCNQIFMTNFEAGVVFVPKMLNADKKTFSVAINRDSNAPPEFQLPYDVPLTAYEEDDVPYQRNV